MFPIAFERVDWHIIDLHPISLALQHLQPVLLFLPVVRHVALVLRQHQPGVIQHYMVVRLIELHQPLVDRFTQFNLARHGACSNVGQLGDRTGGEHYVSIN